MTDEEKKLLEGIGHIIADGPCQHDCENCGDIGQAPISKLPPGWRYISASYELIDTTDDLDKKTLIVCAVCFGLVTRTIKRWSP